MIERVRIQVTSWNMVFRKKYQYSGHAERQKQNRLITDAEVEACLNGWDTQHTDKKGNPVYRARVEGGRGIKVVVASGNPIYIITVADY